MWTRWKSSYTALRLDDDNPNNSQKTHVAKSEVLDTTTRSRFLQFPWFGLGPREILFFAAVISTFIALMIVGFLLRTNSSKAGSSKPVCGSSPAEALSLGCTWDQLTWAWYPKGCPHLGNDEFMAYHNWNYWVDPDGNQQAVGQNWTLALENKKQLWTQRGEHLTHCVFMFLSVGQAMAEDIPLPSVFKQYGHMRHCADYLLEALRQDRFWERVTSATGKVVYDVQC